MADSDFRITYLVTAFYSINTRKSAPIWYCIYGGTNNAEEVRDTYGRALCDGLFEPYDDFVADNTTFIHNDGKAMLCGCWRILVMFLPTQTPEWNSKEVIWVVFGEDGNYVFYCSTVNLQ